VSPDFGVSIKKANMGAELLQSAVQRAGAQHGEHLWDVTVEAVRIQRLGADNCAPRGTLSRLIRVSYFGMHREIVPSGARDGGVRRGAGVSSGEAVKTAAGL